MKLKFQEFLFRSMYYCYSRWKLLLLIFVKVMQATSRNSAKKSSRIIAKFYSALLRLTVRSRNGQGALDITKVTPCPRHPPIAMCRPAIPEDWGHEADTKQKDIKKKKQFVVGMKQQSQFHFTSQQLLQQPKIHN